MSWVKIKCPKHFIITSKSDDGVIQGIENIERLRFGVQFHPENSKDGHNILDNFTNFCIHKRTTKL